MKEKTTSGVQGSPSTHEKEGTRKARLTLTATGYDLESRQNERGFGTSSRRLARRKTKGEAVLSHGLPKVPPIKKGLVLMVSVSDDIQNSINNIRAYVTIVAIVVSTFQDSTPSSDTVRGVHLVCLEILKRTAQVRRYLQGEEVEDDYSIYD